MAKSYNPRRFFLFLYALTLLFSACQEGGEAGDLFGQWRMAGSDSEYISFSGSITTFRTKQQVGAQVFGNFQHLGDSLFIQCYSITEAPADTTIVEQFFGFKPFTDIRLRISKLNGDCLMLTKDGQTWEFYKY